MSDDLKTAIEAIKLRTPIEEVVRERVAGLRRAGALWEACCPFHEERTPSFKVSPQRGTWRCFGACATGGDVISFVEAFDRLSFHETLEVLANRAGVELPRRAGSRDRGRYERLYRVLEDASRYYARAMKGAQGARALDYLRGRGLSEATLEAFGLGYAPVGGDTLTRKATAAGHALPDLMDAGLVRTRDGGGAYDFFRGRLMVPIRDLRGRTVGFGARRLDDSDPRSPKYVNTPETPVFKKGQLVFGLDLAVDAVRRGHHLILVEGYTDVCAAHQVGLRNVAAVLGTATTDEHAALVRRVGARRVTLCFDGDSAGGQATLRALTGLLPLEVELDVVRLEAGRDPCDLLLGQGGSGDGAEAFESAVAAATGWFEFLLGTFDGLDGVRRFEAIDVVLEAIGRLKNPLHVEARLKQLAESEHHTLEAVRTQYESLPARRRETRRLEAERRERAQQQLVEEPADPVTVASRRAWREIAGAVLVEPALMAEAHRLIGGCGDPELARLLQRLAEHHERGGGLPGVDGVLSALGEDPLRHLVVPLLEDAMTAESPQALFEGARAFIERTHTEQTIRERKQRIVSAHEAAPGPESGPDESNEKVALTELFQVLRQSKVEQQVPE